MRLLILGGTSEGRALAERIAGDRRLDVTLSLAGRTSRAISLPVRTRVGGFGGVAGLTRWIEDHGVDAVIDATHPFAAQVSANAVAAAGAGAVPLGSVVREAWVREDGDNWIDVASVQAGAEALPTSPCNVFLSVGRLELGAFAARREHSYLARTIEPPGDIATPPGTTFVFERGPFDIEGEIDLLKRHAIDVVVSKNSGGNATVAKITAARELGLPVIMVARPEKLRGTVLASIDDAVAWLDEIASAHCSPRSDRGV